VADADAGSAAADGRGNELLMLIACVSTTPSPSRNGIKRGFWSLSVFVSPSLATLVTTAKAHDHRDREAVEEVIDFLTHVGKAPLVTETLGL
jgi:hypothetical protein